MKYLRIIAGQTGAVGSYGVLKEGTIHLPLLDRSPFAAPAAGEALGKWSFLVPECVSCREGT